MDSVEIHKDPFGVVLIIGAWNYPLQLTLLPVAGAIAAGNCVVIKPSEVASASAKLIAETIPKYLDNVSFAMPFDDQNHLLYTQSHALTYSLYAFRLHLFRIVIMWFAVVLKKQLNC